MLSPAFCDDDSDGGIDSGGGSGDDDSGGGGGDGLNVADGGGYLTPRRHGGEGIGGEGIGRFHPQAARGVGGGVGGVGPRVYDINSCGEVDEVGPVRVNSLLFTHGSKGVRFSNS